MSPAKPIPSHWSWFFLFVTVAIVATLMVPSLFGLQNVTQWGGMYTDAWCSVFLYPEDPHRRSEVAFEQIWAGKVHTVWSVPMFNKHQCLMWSRKWCGKPSSKGWTVHWVSPYYKGQHFADPKNPCDLHLDPSYDFWFRYVP